MPFPGKEISLMKPLHFCRDAIQEIRRMAQRPEIPPWIQTMPAVLEGSQKFVLPEGGVLLDDPEYRALDDGEVFRLPYPSVALEFYDLTDRDERTMDIVLAHETEDSIMVTALWRYAEPGTPDGWRWRIAFPFELMRIVRQGPKPQVLARSTKYGNARNESFATRTVLSVLNALQCSNVKTALVRPSRLRQQIARDRKALPYDDYHILTIEPARTAKGTGQGSSHRSPREHLRRGHIRRLEDGRKIWVNAHVVSAGNGGKISKDYALR